MFELIYTTQQHLKYFNLLIYFWLIQVLKRMHYLRTNTWSILNIIKEDLLFICYNTIILKLWLLVIISILLIDTCFNFVTFLEILSGIQFLTHNRCLKINISVSGIVNILNLSFIMLVDLVIIFGVQVIIYNWGK